MRLHTALEMLLRLLMSCQGWSRWQPDNSLFNLIAIATTSHKHQKYRKHRSC
jgi:hypothetical protein